MSTQELIFGLLTCSNLALAAGALFKYMQRRKDGKVKKEKEVVQDILEQRDTYKTDLQLQTELARDYREQLGWAHYALTSRGIPIPTHDPLTRIQRARTAEPEPQPPKPKPKPKRKKKEPPEEELS